MVAKISGGIAPDGSRYVVNTDGQGNVTAPADLGSILTLTAQAAGTVNSPDQTSTGRGVVVVFDMTVATTTSIVIHIQGKDVASGKYYDILVSAAVVGVTTNVYTVYPGVTVAANIAASTVLPKTWRVQAVVTGGSSAATGTIGANVLP